VRTLLSTPKLSLKDTTDFRIVAVAVLYYFSARLGYYLAFENALTLPTWPPSGIAFALTILFGRSTWPGIIIGSLVANLLAYWHNPSLPAQTVIMVSSGIAVANTGEALIGSILLKIWVKDKYPFNSAKNAFRFLFITMVMCVMGAATGTLILKTSDIISDDFFYRNAFSSWVSNVVGILLFTPFILSVVQKPSLKITWEKAGEIAIFFFIASGILVLLQIEYVALTFQHALPFLVLPFLLWIAFRFNLSLATTGVMLTSLSAIYITIHNQGPFIMDDSYNTMLLLQIFIGVLSISTIVLSATVKERRQAQQELLNVMSTLETKVNERTIELQEEIQTRKEAEQKIQKTNEELSKRNTELDNFVYSVSHDLRAPIASVLGLINLARKDNSAAMKNTYLEMIHKSALQQDHFIKEILDQSRNSRLEVKREEIYFEPLIEETFDQLKFATHSGEAVKKIITVEQSKPFYSDRWRLKVILNNLLSNSIRYRNGNDPEIKISVITNDGTASLSVEDNGRGIEKAHLPNLFKMFYRATDDGAGSGLGLYIVKETIDKLNGTIVIDSEPHVGTTVRLNIPEIAVQ
jgi:signal transduction histidine kinase